VRCASVPPNDQDAVPMQLRAKPPAYAEVFLAADDPGFISERLQLDLQHDASIVRVCVDAPRALQFVLCALAKSRLEVGTAFVYYLHDLSFR